MMKRRAFLKLLGLAPVASVIPAAAITVVAEQQKLPEQEIVVEEAFTPWSGGCESVRATLDRVFAEHTQGRRSKYRGMPTSASLWRS